MPAVIEIEGLGKKYSSASGDTWAVRDLDLAVPAGCVYGLLGRNGAGKTTTLRALSGLVQADEGHISIFGEACPAKLPKVVRRLGVYIDGVNLDPTLSGRRNLEVLGRLRRIPSARVDEVLELVGLGSRGRDRLSSYSLGMRHRLGIASALLGHPDLLVLDEPTNGLDPAGIVAIRDLIRSLNSQAATTVLLSSHQLGEVAALCDRVAIMAGGRLRAEGTPEEIAGDITVEALESAFMELTNG